MSSLVGDQNDNKPTFTRPIFNVSIREDFLPRDFILRLDAQDPDAGENAACKFTYATGTENKIKFTFDIGISFRYYFHLKRRRSLGEFLLMNNN